MTYWDDSDSSEDCGYHLPGEFEFYDHRDYEAGWIGYDYGNFFTRQL